jgi:hypothetical protein
MTALFALDVLLVLTFSLGWAAVLKPPTRPAFLVTVFILGWADLVLVTEVLSLLVQVTAWGMLIGHALTALVAVLVWLAKGRPRIPCFSLPPRAVLRQSFKSDPDLWIFGSVVAAAYAFLAVIIALVPPNNQDSMLYHLARVGFWIQHRTLAPWPTAILRQVFFPWNAEIGSLWSMVFLRRDTLAGYIQWFSALAGMVSIFGLARLFGSSQSRAAFASFVGLTLPIVVLQSTTTQNDLTVGAMTAAMLFLLLLGLKIKHRGTLLLSGLALGIAAGMKPTAFMVLPGLAVGLGYFVFTRKPKPWKPLFFWAAACCAGFLALGAFNYIQNWITTGSPLGSKAFLKASVNESFPGSWNLIRNNMARDVYSMMDFTGVPPFLVGIASPAWARLGARVFSVIGLPENRPQLSFQGHAFAFQTNSSEGNESCAFFGPFGILLLLPAVVFWLGAGLIKRDVRFIPAMIFLGFMAAIGGTQAWMPFRGRFYLTVLFLSTPLTAGLFGRRAFRRTLQGFIMIAALTIMAVTIATNVTKPLTGPNAIWRKTRFERQSLLWDGDRIPYQIIKAVVPAKATVATVLDYIDFEYPYFGENLSRILVPIYPCPEKIDLAWMKKNRFRYVIVRSVRYCPVEDLPPEEFRVYDHRPFKIIVRLD